MKLQFLGATGTVTGSKYLVAHEGASVMVDCGLFQGYKQLRLRNWTPPPFEPAGIDTVILTHAHIDHCGYLPLLVKRGFSGLVRCSQATYDLCRVMLPDSAHLQEEQAEHANRYGYARHAPALPLYTRADVDRALALFAPVDYESDFTIGHGLTATLFPAGHILGASMVLLSAGGRTLLFSGDLGRPHDPIMRPPAQPGEADALVLESTYGDRLHAGEDAEDVLARIISSTAARGGTTLVPAFALGRAQALLLHIDRLKAAGRIPRQLPIYLDSPMASDVTAIYLRHANLHRLSQDLCERLRQVARHVQTPAESRALDGSSWPMVIIAGSGMATGGRILHHLRRFATDSRNAIVFTGFQAGGTRGDALVHGAGQVKIEGEYVPVRAQVHNIETMSAHADREEILGWLRHFVRAPRRVFLTHGEPRAADVLRRTLRERLGWNCEVPDYLDAAEI
ncbi:MAG TPA: MBL fold metallo-hydrolase [Usitatibacter sp.]|nr:MBL fold metallo-hydrolase [Usitatibacter sp.]